MTIREKIIERLLIAGEERLMKLQEYGAPKIMIEGQLSYVASLEAGELAVKGDKALLDETYETVEPKKGRGGKTYYCFNGCINFFPQARYGMYITKEDK